jgi:hypothetical protein
MSSYLMVLLALLLLVREANLAQPHVLLVEELTVHYHHHPQE